MSNKYLEQLASIEHEQWMGWAKALLESEPNLSKERAAKWKKLFVPYAELSEPRKEQDRVFARKVLKVINGE